MGRRQHLVIGQWAWAGGHTSGELRCGLPPRGLCALSPGGRGDGLNGLQVVVVDLREA